MSYFLNLCDCSVLYCASLEAWNWAVAGQQINASPPRSSIWPNPNVSIFSGNYFGETLNCHISTTVRAFDLIPKLRDRPVYQLSYGTKYKYYTVWLSYASSWQRNHPEHSEQSHWATIKLHKIDIYDIDLVIFLSTDVLPYDQLNTTT